LLDPAAYHEAIRNIFSRNLSRYFNGQERIGVSLTGGLDTRTVMAWQRSAPGSLPCYTYGEANRDCRDVVVARQNCTALSAISPGDSCGERISFEICSLC